MNQLTELTVVHLYTYAEYLREKDSKLDTRAKSAFIISEVSGLMR